MAGATTTSVSEAAQRYAAAVFDMSITSGEVDAVDNGLTALRKLIEGVVEAARLCAACERGEILISEAQERMTRSGSS